MEFAPAKELALMTLREQPLPADMLLADTPDKAVEFWQATIANQPRFNAEVENFAVLFLNTRRRVRGFQIISQGTADTLLVHPREVFRTAILANAAALILLHNHPSGEATPSEADVKVTRDLIRAGQLLKIEVVDHVIVGNQQRASLRELGYFSA
jgi:DNA repair protein RadC